MSDISSNIIVVILVTSFATYLSRFLGVVSSEKIKETSKIFKWFNCIAYSVLAALIARMVIFPANIKHTGTTCSDEKRRVVINFNFYPSDIVFDK